MTRLKPLILATAIVVSSFTTALVNFLPANAASYADSVITPVNKLELNQHGITLDISNTWRTHLDAATGNADMISNCIDNNLERGYGWGAAEWGHSSDPSIKQAYIWCTSSTNPAYFAAQGAYYTDVPVLVAPASSGCYLYLRDAGGAVDAYCGGGTADYAIANQSTTDNFTKLFPFFINHPINYPEGYEGTTPGGAAGATVVINPTSKITVQSKALTIYNAIDNKGVESPYGRFGSTCEGGRNQGALIFDCDELTMDYPKLYGTTREVAIKYVIKDELGAELKVFNDINFDQNMKYEFEKHGDYTVVATFNFRDTGEQVPLALEVDDITYNFGKMTFNLKIDGKSYYGDQTAGSEQDYPVNCTTTGADTECDTPDLTANMYDDCTLYGTDVVGGFGCVIKNFGIFLRETAIKLFVPDSDDFMATFNDLKGTLEASFGFLTYPFVVLFKLLNAIVSVANAQNIVCDVNFGNMFGNQMHLNFCSMEDNIPTLFNTMRGLIISITVIALVVGIRNKWQQVITS